MTNGSESPCTTSVTRMTANARKMISSRSGNGAPASVDSGIASAAASETAPRIPDQQTITPCTPGRRQVAATRMPRSAGGRYAKGTVSRNRISTTAPHTARPLTSSSFHVHASSPSRIAGSWSPMSANRTALRAKVKIAQKATP